MTSPTPEQIRAVREAASLTQAQAAALVGSPSRKAWENWERGRNKMPPAKWELFRNKVAARNAAALGEIAAQEGQP